MCMHMAMAVMRSAFNIVLSFYRNWLGIVKLGAEATSAYLAPDWSSPSDCR